MLGKINSYTLYLKEGKLAALLMQDGGQMREARGSRLARRTTAGTTRRPFSTARRSDCRSTWTASSTRPTVRPGPTIPVDISPIGASTSQMMGAIVFIASPGCGSPFVGWLDEVSIFHRAFRPAEFCFRHDYPTPYGSAAVTLPNVGVLPEPAL